MAETAPPHAPLSHGALQMLSAACDSCVAMLVTDGGEEDATIADIHARTELIGHRIRVPSALLGDVAARFDTYEARLSLLWTDMCGDRPDWISAAPVPGHPMHVLIAGSGEPPVEAAILPVAAGLIGRILDTRQTARREHDASRRVMTLIAHLPVPVVFVDSAETDVLLNDRARSLLGVGAGEVQPSRLTQALAALINGDRDETRRRALEADPRVSLMFEISTSGVMGVRRYQVATRWIDEGDLSGRIWLFRDTTSEKAFQAQLTELAQLLELTVENIAEGVMLVDENRRVVLWNQACVDLLMLPPEMADRGADFVDIFRLLYARGELGSGPIEEAMAESERRVELYGYREREIQRADGHIIDLRYTAITGGHFLLTARDVTDERTAARFKDELIATVSHELRTPLTAITGSLGLLKAGLAGALTEQATGLVEVAHRNSDRLGLLVNDLLDMDKLSAGKLEFRFADTEIQPLLAEAIEQNTPYGLNFGVGFKLIAPDEPVVVEIDPDRIAQVMSNLLSNAAKFSPSGSDVTVQLTKLLAGVRISVIDHGRGMSPEFRRRLFTRFAQEDRSIERGQAGTGLGLAITKSIVDYHGGTIMVDSILGEGTRFDVNLPRRRPKA